MVFAVGVGLILVAALAVCAPLFRAAPLDAAPDAPADARARWQKQKQDAYAAIKEAELDLQMGKLAQTDFDLIRTAQEARALEALRALEAAAPAADGSVAASACPRCGARGVRDGQRGSGTFCTACGARRVA
jgi:hypothetical protein